MSRYRDQLAAALGAVAIRGSDSYAWLGRHRRAVPAGLGDALDASARRDYLIARLRDDLYLSFYCHGGVAPARSGDDDPVVHDPRLVRALAAANAGCGSWQEGWTVERIDRGEAVVTSAALRARVPLAACRAPGGEPAPGAAIGLPLPKELPALSPGFFTIVGDAGDEGAAGVVRVYWHVTCAGAPLLARTLTTWLNADGVPFRLKLADHPRRFDRCDAGVLYLRDRDFAAARPELADIATGIASYLRPDVPPFTLALAPGVGLAECEGARESFGVRRCGLLAAGIVTTHEQGIRRREERLAAVIAHFARDGVDVDAPYLEPALAGRHVL